MSRLQRAATRAASIALCVSASQLFAETTVRVGSKEIQVHGSTHQGFAKIQVR